MRKTKLIVDYELGDSVIGIVTTIKEYKLAWSINQVFKINLIMQPPLKIEFLKGNILTISNYLYQTDFQLFRLIKNKGSVLNSGYIIPELVNFDFFLMISGKKGTESAQIMFDQLKTIVGIDYFNWIDVDKLKSKDNFIF